MNEFINYKFFRSVTGLKLTFLIILLVSAFGPYVISKIGLRLDHLVIYLGFIILTAIFIFKNYTVQINYYILFLILSFSVLVVVPLLVNVFSEYNYVSVTAVLAGIENYLQPLVIIAITVFIFSNNTKENNKSLYIKFLKVLILLLCINVLFSFLLFYVGPGELTKVFGGGGRGDTAGLNVVERALSGGRGAGVFTQPIEGGVAYVIGLLCWFYLYRIDEKFNRELRNNIQFYMLLIGGVLVGSKVFVVLGPIIILFYLNPFKKYKSLFNIRFIVIGIIMTICFILLVNNWKGAIPIDRGFVYTTRLFNIKLPEGEKTLDLDYENWFKKRQSSQSSQNELGLFNTYLSIYTSGRFGNKYSITNLLVYSVESSPWYGFGFGVYLNSDNSILEVIRNAGLIGVFFYCAVFIVLIYKGIAGSLRGNEDERLLLALWILLLFASVGAPIVTANRISIFIWLITTYTLMQSSSKMKINISASSIKLEAQNVDKI